MSIDVVAEDASSHSQRICPFGDPAGGLPDIEADVTPP